MVASEIQEKIEAELATAEPEVEVVLAELTGGSAGGTVRLFIDHPDGVNHELCARVTEHLRGWLDRYALEVSSPGIERPLTKPEHFRRFLGRSVRVRPLEPIDGRKWFTGDLVAAGDSEISLALADGATVTIPLERIGRANLVAELD